MVVVARVMGDVEADFRKALVLAGAGETGEELVREVLGILPVLQKQAEAVNAHLALRRDVFRKLRALRDRLATREARRALSRACDRLERRLRVYDGEE